MNVTPTAKMTAVGACGIGAMIVMGMIDQLVPGMIDFTKEVSGVPLGALIVALATFIGGWLKREL